MKAADFTYCTANKEELKLSDTLQKADKTFLLFSRYMGCPFCQVDMLELSEEYSRFVEKNSQILVVLQSAPETLRSQTVPNEPPFEIICDPKGSLYKLYGVKVAASTLKMIKPGKKLFRKTVKLLKYRLKHGAYEGNEQQLPALFLLDQERNILYFHQAAHLADLPDAEEMLSLL
ncbi:MAG: AhpC/TSA family protein [Oscillospiraceae bacterium]|nr:AhpC/TSA family protein [Oscillospiraceae bacterium]